ncbi:MAG: S-layer homology domain-containing protein [Selenomonadales bacterium]|nr:S-layer homology domain-containing protein [Selenomonadales bacterium]
MNKKLTAFITTALMIGATSAALANPFADVPADHWAYDAVDQLVADGVIEGYANGAFDGEKEITRYEMAQMVARAMANCEGADAADKATIDKLAAEFSAELDSLGVRVDALEKKVAGIKDVELSGYYMVTYGHEKGEGSSFGQEAMLNIDAPINDKLGAHIGFMVVSDDLGESSETYNQLEVANITYEADNSVFTVGRYAQELGATGYLMSTDGSIDGVNVDLAGDKLSASLGYADYGVFDMDRSYYATVGYAPCDNFNAVATYWKGDGNLDDELFGIGASFSVAKDLTLTGDYWKNDDTSADGQVIKLTYGNLDEAVKGTYSLGVEYNKWEAGVLPAIDDMTGADFTLDDRKFWAVIGEYTLAENVLFRAYHTFNTKTEGGSDLEDFTGAEISFSF